MSAFKLYEIPNDCGEERVPFDFQYDGGVAGRNCDTVGIQKIGTEQSCADIVVECDAYITGRKEEWLTRIVYDGSGP